MNHLSARFPANKLHELKPITDTDQWNAHGIDYRTVFTDQSMFDQSIKLI